jgi:hypothetical protein
VLARAKDRSSGEQNCSPFDAAVRTIEPGVEKRTFLQHMMRVAALRAYGATGDHPMPRVDQTSDDGKDAEYKQQESHGGL